MRKVLKSFNLLSSVAGVKTEVDVILTAAGVPSTSCDGVSGCADCRLGVVGEGWLAATILNAR